MAVDADVIIVGAGPAGLSAALILGRACHQVLIFDSNRPRNYAAREIHGFLTRDGIGPFELRRLGLEELRRYDTVRVESGEVTPSGMTTARFESRSAMRDRSRPGGCCLRPGSRTCCLTCRA